jgi:hypothetical protein
LPNARLYVIIRVIVNQLFITDNNPNLSKPTKSGINIDGKDIKVSHIEILSMDGKIVFKEDYTHPSNTIQLPFNILSTQGIYLIKISDSEGKNYIEKVIKE